MDYLSQILANPNQERSVTIKTKPEKREAAPEAPLDPSSANIPQSVMEMLMMGQAQKPAVPPDLLQALMMGGLGGGSSTPPAVDPMMGQIPMDVPVPAFNPYGV